MKLNSCTALLLTHILLSKRYRSDLLNKVQSTSELCGICFLTALSCGGQPVNGEGQLLSDVQILMLIGQICTALQPFRQSAETCCEGERMAGRILQKKRT